MLLSNDLFWLADMKGFGLTLTCVRSNQRPVRHKSEDVNRQLEVKGKGAEVLQDPTLQAQM